ncbi:MAG: IS110 family transposase [Bacteroidota bacterium]
MSSFASSFLRQSVGIDVSSRSLDLCFATEGNDREIRFGKSHKVVNQLSGFEQMMIWLSQQGCDLQEVVFVMEATGIYYERCAQWLDQKGYKVVVLLPNKAKAFTKSLNIKTKSDRVDAMLLARMGCERKLSLWQPLAPIYKNLRQVSRHRQNLIQKRTMAKNQLHAAQNEAPICETVIESIQIEITNLNALIKRMDQAIKKLMQSDEQASKNLELLCSIPSVGWASAIHLLAETAGFTAFRNQRQLISYAGFDVVQKQSGSSLNAPQRISKRGNARIRRALYFPALTIRKSVPHLENLYQRIYAKNPQTKMKSVVAIQRKILCIAYQIIKTQTEFDPDKLGQKKCTETSVAA